MNPAPPDSGPLVYCARRPHPPLGRWVECLWLAQGYADSARYKVLPNGVVELIINLGEESHGVVDARRPSRVVNFGQSWVAGLQLAAITVESLTRTALIGVRFLPGGATALLTLPAAELTNQVVGLEAMRTQEVASIRERLLEPATCRPVSLQPRLRRVHGAHAESLRRGSRAGGPESRTGRLSW